MSSGAAVIAMDPKQFVTQLILPQNPCNATLFDYPTVSGRQVRWGFLQSIPSSK